MAITIGGSPPIAAIPQKKYDSVQWLSKGFSHMKIFSRNPRFKLSSSPLPFHGAGNMPKETDVHVVTPDMSSPRLMPELLDAWNDDYNGVVINPESLPMSANAFASALRASLSHWKLKGKKGVWLKILQEQAELVPIAIQEGFNYHHAESGYVMLTHWLPDDLCMLPGSPSHQIGVGAFVINDKREVLVVKEKCPCSCSGVWKFPTGYINKSEDIFSGAIREVKEETGVDTVFLEIVAFRHAHFMAFENSDLLFVCMLKPMSCDIIVDEKEIQAAKWMPLEEFIGQPFYQDDPMSKKVTDICIAAHEDRYCGYVGQQLASKLDCKLSYLYNAAFWDE
ncbi:Nudix hydrolase 8 [Morus notabilis]|uniref:Nudix hydrolase 8 n=1 Tax=Morus notabilis TaxID=981085 RepID=W9QX14_9ROSA|nr:nudix hydrolase 8 [Morus notabilis]EXB24700.1 Nudix hydrolase 8 [Morus notabilis]